MALPQQKFREVVVQMLYASEFAPTEDDEFLPFFMEEHQAPKKAMGDAQRQADAVRARLAELDEQIGPASTEFTLERIGRVELSILRLALYELLFDAEIPPKVILSEAVRLCRKYGTPGSAHFVNAVLDRIYKKHVTVPKTAAVE